MVTSIRQGHHEWQTHCAASGGKKEKRKLAEGEPAQFEPLPTRVGRIWVEDRTVIEFPRLHPIRRGVPF